MCVYVQVHTHVFLQQRKWNAAEHFMITLLYINTVLQASDVYRYQH